MPSLLPKKIVPFVRMGAGALEMASVELAEQDENETGTDDKIAGILHYASQLTLALASGNPIPQPPMELFKAVNGAVAALPNVVKQP